MKKAAIALLFMALVSHNAVEGVKLGGEPPAKSINKGDTEDKTDKEKEEQQKEIADAAKVNEAMKKGETEVQVEAAKKNHARAVAIKKAQEAEWSKLELSPDGLQHWPDGRNWYVPDGQVVGGVNHYA